MIPARHLIIRRLYEANAPLPIHALDIPQVSQTSASARLREMAREGLVESDQVPGKRWTAWKLVKADLSLPLVGM